MVNEELVWTGSPSQVINAPVFIVCALLCWLVIPVFVALWKWLVIRSIRYELTTERLKLRQGVLNRTLDELELYRVRDYKLEQPFFLRIFSLGNIIIRTTDTTHPYIVLRAIRDGENVLELVRRNVEECRAKKNVRALDLE
jgi:uncharacterized membrane protein YdbT with pleckstrin-like domain